MAEKSLLFAEKSCKIWILYYYFATIIINEKLISIVVFCLLKNFSFKVFNIKIDRLISLHIH